MKVYLFMALGALTGTSVIEAQPTILDWDQVQWTPTEQVANHVVDGVAIGIEVSDESAALVNATPAIFSYYQGDQAAVVNALMFSASLPMMGAHSEVVIDIELGEQGVGVDDLSFKLFDVDAELGLVARQENFLIAAALGETTVLPAIITGNIDVHDIGDHAVTGLLPTDTIGGNSAQGVVQVSFNQPVDALSIRFSVTGGAMASPNTTTGFALYDLVFSALGSD